MIAVTKGNLNLISNGLQTFRYNSIGWVTLDLRTAHTHTHTQICNKVSIGFASYMHDDILFKIASQVSFSALTGILSLDKYSKTTKWNYKYDKINSDRRVNNYYLQDICKIN